MQRRPVIIAVHQLGYGGVSNAVVDQARMFAEAGHPTTIATLTSEPRGVTRTHELRESGRLHPDVTTVNLFEDTARQQTRSGSALRRYAGAGRRLLNRVRARFLLAETGVESDGGRYRRMFDRSGDVARFTRFDEQGRAVVDEISQGGVLVRRDRYRGGSLAERVVFDRQTGNKTQDRYYTPDGFCFMVRWQSPRTGKGTGVFVLDRKHRRVQRYAGLPDWGAAWLEQVARRQPRAPIVLAESPSVIPKIARIPAEAATRVGVLHNNQFAAPHEVGSAVRGDHEPIFAAVDDLDALVVLTPQQRDDLIDLIGHRDKIHVVPNSVTIPDVEAARESRVVSIVSRLSPQKSMHEAIAAMSMVLEDIPDARLEIYGRGPDAARLAGLIQESGHANRITLEGRTDRPAEAMARSLCTLSTSQWEAMPLSILESMAAGTPVVAYDCRYGPAALISDGVTGRLVAKGDRRALADAVISLLRDPAAADRMGSAAREFVTGHHTPEAVSAIWEGVFARLEPATASRG